MLLHEYTVAVNDSAEVASSARHFANSMLPMLKSWVTENSYSKSLDGVNRMGDLLVDAFAMDGLSVERHCGCEVGDHFVWKSRGWDRPGAKRVLLVGHHDTVFPPGAFDVWSLEGDKLTGPGVLDMKGGLATIWAALSALAKVGHLTEIPLAFVSVGDEEIGSPESASLTQQLAMGAAGALVFEAGRQGDAIITRRKGTGALIAIAKGVSAHAGNHHAEGVNAIVALSRFVERVSSLTDYDSGMTVNVGLIEGGEARNTVPGHARCEIDFRLIQAADGEALVRKVQEVAEIVSVETGATIEVSGGIRRLPLERTAANVALCARYSACAIDAGLSGPEADLIGGGSDASTVSAVGVAAIDGLGPRGAGFHTHHEWIEVSSLALRADALTRFLLGWQAS